MEPRITHTDTHTHTQVIADTIQSDVMDTMHNAIPQTEEPSFMTLRKTPPHVPTILELDDVSRAPFLTDLGADLGVTQSNMQKGNFGR